MNKFLATKKNIWLPTIKNPPPSFWSTDPPTTHDPSASNSWHVKDQRFAVATAPWDRFAVKLRSWSPTVDGHQKSGIHSPVEGRVVEIPLFTGFWDTSLVVVWDFWTINSMCGKIHWAVPPTQDSSNKWRRLVWDAGIHEPILGGDGYILGGGKPNKYIPSGSLLV